MYKHMVWSLIFVFCLTVVSFKAHAYENGDFQIWHTEGQEVKIGKATKLTQEQEWYYGNNASELYCQHYEWGVAWAFDKRLDIAVNYRQVYEKKKFKWMEENRPFVTATARFDLWKFRLEDRNRIEYRHFRYKDDFIRYRNRIMLKHPFDLLSIKFVPYLADEFFIASNATGLNQNRIYSGVEVEFIKNIRSEAYYLIQSNRVIRDKWSTANVLGLKLKLAF